MCKHNQISNIDIQEFLLKNYSNSEMFLDNNNCDEFKIYVGAGTCGLGAGAGKTIAKIESITQDFDSKPKIYKVGCIGICALEPIVDIKLSGMARISFSRVTETEVEELLKKVLKGEIPTGSVIGQFKNGNDKLWENVPLLSEHPFFKKQKRWVLENCGIIEPTNIDEYLSHGGFKSLAKTLCEFTPAQVCDYIEQSGLKGRGGGGFMTGLKWKLANKVDSDTKYLICNADEGDPGAFMDRAVIEGDPYKLIEGITIASYAIGAEKAYVYIRAEYPQAIRHLKESIGKAMELGLLGNNILGKGYNLEIKIKMGAGAFVCGEETALIGSIEGKRGMPRPRPPFPTEAGLFGKPTCINNVETLANVPVIMRIGADKFAEVGTKTSKGTKVFALSGNITNTGLVEVEMGIELKDIIFDIGGGIPNGKKFKAVQIGGPSGGCIPMERIDIKIDYESLKTVGAMMGSGGLVVMDETACMVDVAKFFMEFIQKESCGKCIPCREGTKRMLEILNKITSSPHKGASAEQLERFQSIMNLQNLATVIQDTSLCGLGKSAPNPVLSTLRWFKHEYEEHIYEKKCSTKKCKELLRYSIIQDNCTGCSICMKNCPTGAILGTLKHPHYIVDEKCISCGACVDVCNFEAILVE
jgi:NADH:ubiquinone oxidoreductase subunit F (NADH-binding)/(2Fe-2S) ferredoxin